LTFRTGRLHPRVVPHAPIGPRAMGARWPAASWPLPGRPTPRIPGHQAHFRPLASYWNRAGGLPHLLV